MDRFQRLTPRQLEVFNALISEGTIKELAFRLGMSIKTVGAHQAAIYAKLGVYSRVSLVLFASQHNLLPAQREGAA